MSWWMHSTLVRRGDDVRCRLCVVPRVHRLDKLREEQQLAKKQLEDKELAECTFQPNAHRRARSSSAGRSRPSTPGDLNASRASYAPSQRVLSIIIDRRDSCKTPLSSRKRSRTPASARGAGRVSAVPSVEHMAFEDFAEYVRGGGVVASTAAFTAPGTSTDRHAAGAGAGAGAATLCTPVPQRALSRGSAEDDGAGSADFDVDACMADFDKCLQTFLAVTSPVKASPDVLRGTPSSRRGVGGTSHSGGRGARSPASTASGRRRR